MQLRLQNSQHLSASRSARRNASMTSQIQPEFVGTHFMSCGSSNDATMPAFQVHAPARPDSSWRSKLLQRMQSHGLLSYQNQTWPPSRPMLKYCPGQGGGASVTKSIHPRAAGGAPATRPCRRRGGKTQRGPRHTFTWPHRKEKRNQTAQGASCWNACSGSTRLLGSSTSISRFHNIAKTSTCRKALPGGQIWCPCVSNVSSRA